MRYLLIVAALLLPGCAMFDGPQPLYDSVSVTVTLVDTLPPDIAGRATWNGPSCYVLLRRDTYPYCLQHEMRHCFEGAFHGSHPSSEDCYH